MQFFSLNGGSWGKKKKELWALPCAVCHAATLLQAEAASAGQGEALSQVPCFCKPLPLLEERKKKVFLAQKCT